MTAGVVALFAAAGVTAWVYSFFYRQTGGNTKSAAIIAGVAGVASFIVMFIVFNAIT